VALAENDSDRASIALDAAVHADNPEIVGEARRALGILNERTDNPDAARECYEAAIALKVEPSAHQAALHLHDLLAGQGKVDAAAEVLEKLTTEHGACVHLQTARLALASYYYERSDLAAVRPLLEQAALGASEHLRELADLQLAGVDEREHNLAKAIERISRRTDSAHKDIRAQARVGLAEHRLDAGLFDEAEALLTSEVFDDPDEELRQAALVAQAALLAARGSDDAAMPFLLDGADSTREETAARANVLLGEIYERQGTLHLAFEAFNRAAQATVDPLARRAREGLSRLAG
jgi:predicted negative regulator of RcsB-dependent stress response